MRFLLELSTFARRHPEANVVVVVESSTTSGIESEGLSLADTLASLETSLPVLAGDFPWPTSRNLVLALDPDGRVRGQLVPQPNRLDMYELVTQDLLDQLLSTATAG